MSFFITRETYTVTLPLIKANPLPLEQGEVFQVSQGQKKFLQKCKFL